MTWSDAAREAALLARQQHGDKGKGSAGSEAKNMQRSAKVGGVVQGDAVRANAKINSEREARMKAAGFTFGDRQTSPSVWSRPWHNVSP